jgi:hypothetical protein
MMQEQSGPVMVTEATDGVDLVMPSACAGDEQWMEFVAAHDRLGRSECPLLQLWWIRESARWACGMSLSQVCE